MGAFQWFHVLKANCHRRAACKRRTDPGKFSSRFHQMFVCAVRLSHRATNHWFTCLLLCSRTMSHDCLVKLQKRLLIPSVFSLIVRCFARISSPTETRSNATLRVSRRPSPTGRVRLNGAMRFRVNFVTCSFAPVHAIFCASLFLSISAPTLFWREYHGEGSWIWISVSEAIIVSLWSYKIHCTPSYFSTTSL